MEMISFRTLLESADKQIEIATNPDSYLDDESEKLDFQFFSMEYDGVLRPEEIDKAKSEISLALKNFANSSFVQDFLRNGNYLIAQRTLRRSQDGVTVNCTPDLVAFYESDPL